MTEYDASTEYDLSTRRLIDALNQYGVGVSNVTDTIGRTTIDFSLGSDEDLSVLQRASGGRFGSSLVVDTTNDEIVTATLRYGSLDLDEEADDFVAIVEAEKAVRETNPPLDVGTASEQGIPPVSPGEGIPGIVVRLRQMGGDILHIIVDERVDVGEFIAWLDRLDPVIRRRKSEMREKANRIGRDMQ